MKATKCQPSALFILVLTFVVGLFVGMFTAKSFLFIPNETMLRATAFVWLKMTEASGGVELKASSRRQLKCATNGILEAFFLLDFILFTDFPPPPISIFSESKSSFVPTLNTAKFHLYRHCSRHDSARLVILYAMGGVYLDSDYITLRGIDSLIGTCKFIASNQVEKSSYDVIRNYAKITERSSHDRY